MMALVDVAQGSLVQPFADSEGACKFVATSNLALGVTASAEVRITVAEVSLAGVSEERAEGGCFFGVVIAWVRQNSGGR